MARPRPLPGVAPAAADDWVRVDETYARQMARREELLDRARADVLWMGADALDAAQEVLTEALAILPRLGFAVGPEIVRCPDGRRVTLRREDPLGTLGRLVQEDICILEKRRDEHVLTAAVLCFPASWRLADKAGRPLGAIHDPVAAYDADLARRVQRLFDGVRPGRPLWRHNRLLYADPELHQPWRSGPDDAPAAYLRSERQCILRLARTRAVVFSIHSYVVALDAAQSEDVAQDVVG